MRVQFQLTAERIVGSLIWTMGSSSLLVALIPRSSLNQVIPGELPSVLPSDFTNASHIVNALFLAALACGIAYASSVSVTQRKGRAVCLAAVLLTGPFALSAFFGTVPDFLWKMVVWPVAIGVVYLLPRPPLEWVVKQFHHLFMIFVVGSLALAVVAPHWALAGTGGSALSAFLSRTTHLQGLTQQYDEMGIVALLGLLTSYWLVDIRLRRASIVLCALALVLAGARTSILAALVSIAFLWIYRDWRNQVFKGVSVMMVFGASAIGLVYASLAGFFGASSGYLNLATLNGRVSVWSLTLDQWRQNPIFGYGPELWSPAYRANHGINGLAWVGMAHNQFVQTLGESGVVGLAALIAFVLVLLGSAWRSRAKDQGLSLSLVLALVVIMITEAPVVLNTLPVPPFPTFAVVIIAMGSASAVSRHEPLEPAYNRVNERAT